MSLPFLLLRIILSPVILLPTLELRQLGTRSLDSTVVLVPTTAAWATAHPRRL